MNAQECKQLLIKHAGPKNYKLSFSMVITSHGDSKHYKNLLKVKKSQAP